MKRKLIILFITLLSFHSYSQPTLDTINSLLKGKPHVFARVDTRNSFIENSRAQSLGLKVVIHYGKRLYFGLGYNQLFHSAPTFNKQVYYTNTGNWTDSTEAKLKLWYISAHAEYVFH